MESLTRSLLSGVHSQNGGVGWGAAEDEDHLGATPAAGSVKPFPLVVRAVAKMRITFGPRTLAAYGKS